jgi:hypothetical protein
MALEFFQNQNYGCRTGAGTQGYTIVYPFYGLYPGSMPKYSATFVPGTSEKQTELGQFDTLADAQAACESHFATLPP